MPSKRRVPLTRREREIMDVLFHREAATVAEVREGLEDPPSYSAVRATLRIMEEKRHVRHRQDGLRYVYLPAVPAEKARRAALRHLVRTFFDGSPEAAAVALLRMSEAELSERELEQITTRIARAREEG